MASLEGGTNAQKPHGHRRLHLVFGVLVDQLCMSACFSGLVKSGERIKSWATILVPYGWLGYNAKSRAIAPRQKKGRDKARPKSNREVEGDACLDMFLLLSLIYGQYVNASREKRTHPRHACYALRLCLASTLGCFAAFLAPVGKNFFLDEITKHRHASRRAEFFGISQKDGHFDGLKLG